MQDVKSFVASAGWLTGFKRRYGLKAVEEGGDIHLDFTSEPATTEFTQRFVPQIEKVPRNLEAQSTPDAGQTLTLSARIALQR